MKYAKKIVALLLVVAMTASIAVAGTLAYLTDRDSKTNVFTIGNVSIELEEEFEQGSELVPGVDVKKEAKITNTGANDAYVWMTLAVPAALDNIGNGGASGSDKNVLHWNVPGAVWEGYHTNPNYVATAKNNGWVTDEELDDNGLIPLEHTWNVNEKVAVQKDVEINGVKYNVYTLLYNSALKPGETTSMGLCKVFLDGKVDIDPNGDLYVVENGNKTGPYWNVNSDGNPMVYVSAYGIQTDNLADVKAAYDAYNGQWGDNGTEYGTVPAIVTTAEDLNNALQTGDDVLLTDNVSAPLSGSAIYGTPVAVQQKNGGVIDGGGNSLEIEDPQYNGYAIETYGGTIQNLSIHSTVGRGVVISSPTEDIYLYNVTVDGPGYALNTTEHNGQNLYVYGSTLRGWTSFAGLESATFGGCFFGENSSKYWQNMGYDQDYDRLVRPYVNTVFEHCVFEQGFYIDLSALEDGCTVTLTNCICVDLNGDVIAESLTADNYASYVTIELPEGRTLADCVVFN